MLFVYSSVVDCFGYFKLRGNVFTADKIMPQISVSTFRPVITDTSRILQVIAAATILETMFFIKEG